MSLLWTLRRYVDQIQYSQEDAQLRRKRETPPGEADKSGALDETPPARMATRPAVCRVCGHEGQVGEYCPTCLADTMVPKRR